MPQSSSNSLLPPAPVIALSPSSSTSPFIICPPESRFSYSPNRRSSTPSPMSSPLPPIRKHAPTLESPAGRHVHHRRTASIDFQGKPEEEMKLFLQQHQLMARTSGRTPDLGERKTGRGQLWDIPLSPEKGAARSERDDPHLTLPESINSPRAKESGIGKEWKVDPVEKRDGKRKKEDANFGRFSRKERKGSIVEEDGVSFAPRSSVVSVVNYFKRSLPKRKGGRDSNESLG
eukprot:CAMPEP_0201490094 /NCGR_PEP_ID=MMETSP0151_2-20130828/25006_1 /ASSEMBLY_ACC=CAM_ASM_000257 /TAXON_ID=200890 /ORGANISM="Paramoeba atlantica, Strain 621/1 / CCAP 1560/9" /LENGTH=231 /DNA_ID=CAMNT_0047875909 /DNA_START=99 /DNA_END=794 /DNA_ORIENTATION=+